MNHYTMRAKKINLKLRGANDNVPLSYSNAKTALYLLEQGANPLIHDKDYEFPMPYSVYKDVREYARNKLMEYCKSELEHEKG